MMKNQSIRICPINNPQKIFCLNSHYATPIPNIEKRKVGLIHMFNW